MQTSVIECQSQSHICKLSIFNSFILIIFYILFKLQMPNKKSAKWLFSFFFYIFLPVFHINTFQLILSHNFIFYLGNNVFTFKVLGKTCFCFWFLNPINSYKYFIKMKSVPEIQRFAWFCISPVDTCSSPCIKLYLLCSCLYFCTIHISFASLQYSALQYIFGTMITFLVPFHVHIFCLAFLPFSSVTILNFYFSHFEICIT